MNELILGRYRPIAQAGEGGYAQVIVAWDIRIERRVAIKCLPLEREVPLEGAEQTGELSAVQMDMLEPTLPGLSEARTAAKLSDANIVSVFDFEVADGVAYLIMEYVEGMSLGDLMRDYPEFIDADVAASVFKAVAHGLQVAHRNGVLHLDIKPDNILIDRQGHVKVVDFGIARLASSSGFGAAEGGTIGYMPPEQMRREPLDERCDEWALASVVYEMISGENPFVVDTLEEAEDAIYDAELIIPSLCLDGLDEAIDDVLFCALDPDREERYDSVKEFAEALQPCLGSTRKGTKQLANVVGHAYSDEEDEEETASQEAFQEETYFREGPLINTFSDTFKGAILRIITALGTAFLVAPALANSPLDGVSNPWFWGVAAAFALVGGVFPSFGLPVAALALAVAFIIKGSPMLGVLLLAATIAWWYLVGRSSHRASCVAAMSALFGSIGLAPIAAFASGYLLRAPAAVGTTLYALLLSFALGALGSQSLLGWNPVSNLMIADGPSIGVAVGAMVANLGMWLQVLAWLATAVVVSLLCSRGNRVLGVLAVAIGLALQIAAILVGAFSTTTGIGAFDPLSIVQVVAVGMAMAAAIIIGIPEREDAYVESEDYEYDE